MGKVRTYFVAYVAEKWWVLKFTSSMIIGSHLVGADLYKSAQSFIEKENPGYAILITVLNEIPSE